MKRIETIRDSEMQRRHMWDSRRIEDEVCACPRRVIVRYFLEHLPKDAPILEAGCGLGAWVIFLGERGYDIVGIDNDPNVIERAKAWKPSLNVQYGDVRNLPFGDETFGAVISLGVLEHFEEGWGEALREARRVLRPGGLLFLTVPMNNLFRRLFAHPVRFLYLWWTTLRGRATYFAEFRYSPREVEAEVRRCGFEPLRITWDDFAEGTMSYGMWTDLPPLRAKALFEMKLAGRAAAWVLNSISPWIGAEGVLCIALKNAKTENDQHRSGNLWYG